MVDYTSILDAVNRLAAIDRYELFQKLTKDFTPEMTATTTSLHPKECLLCAIRNGQFDPER